MTHLAATGPLTPHSEDFLRPRSACSLPLAPSICVHTTRLGESCNGFDQRKKTALRPKFVAPFRKGFAMEQRCSGQYSVRRNILHVSATGTRESVDFGSLDAKNSMAVLEKIFLPIVMRRVLRSRKNKRMRKDIVPRIYSCESIVDAIRSSNSLMSNWPVEMLKAFASQATYLYLEPNEIVVHENEKYFSSGLIILLYGDLIESRRDAVSDAPRSSAVIRHATAPEVLCDRVVLCRDASVSTWAARYYTDVAFIPARWVWDVINNGIEEFPEASESVLECIKTVIVPMSRKLTDDVYYPTPLVFRRSWMWPLLGVGDRAKLARVMESRVLCIGDKLYSEGDRDPYMHIIRRGSVAVFVQKEPLCTFNTGNAFGEVSMLFDDPRSSTVVATTMCELYSLHRDYLLKRMRKKQGLCEAIVARALQRRRQWLEVGKTRELMGLAALLAAVPCLSQTTDKMRMELARTATPHVIPPREKMFAKGDRCAALFVIGRGSLALRSEADARAVPTAARFVGEFCLQPHRWPTDVVALTSVDGWLLSADAIVQTLSTINGQAQAVTICRQGIELYRAQHGFDSVVEELAFCKPCATQPDAAPPVSIRTRSITSASTSNGLLQPLSKRNSLRQGGEPKEKKDGKDSGEEEAVGGMIKSYENYDWSSLLVSSDRAMSLISVTSNQSLRPRSGEVLRALEQNIERELLHSAQNFVSLPESNVPSAVDCDFSGEVDIVQQRLVEQLFLLPSSQQPHFLRQINCSKVALPSGDPLADFPEQFLPGGTVMDDFTLMKCVDSPSVVCAIDGDSSGADAVQTPVDPLTTGVSPRANFLDISARNSLQTQGSLCEATAGFFPRASWHRCISSHGRPTPRPSSAFGALRTPTRASSAGYSQLTMSPNISFASRTSNFLTHVESPASDSLSMQSNVNSWVMSASVDLSQQAKINAMTFQSALDRYIKVNDQSYFHDIIPVDLPLQREIQWTSEDEYKANMHNKGDLVLLLMHIRCCIGLNILDTIALPIVKVTTGSRVLLRTSIMDNRVRPVWVIEVASFITFIRRSASVVFSVCDAEDETKIAYSAVMPEFDFAENGGVGLHIMRLSPEIYSNEDEEEDSKARLEVCMMAVTASKYDTLQKQLAEDTEEELSVDDSNTVYLQMLGVEGLEYPIEPTVVVSVECDGKTTEIMRTPHITPKTLSPSWPGQSSFCVVNGDGVVTFDLYDCDELIAYYNTPIDTLAFGGTGIHFFSLLRPQGETPGDSCGEIVVSILGTKNSGDEIITRRETKALAVHIESFQMFQSSEEEFVPDPFVILRGPKGDVVLRTPLSMGAYEAKWSEEDASCFVMCPSLKGSVSVYNLEVYDNNERNKIGVAEMIVTTDGTSHNRLQYRIAGKGVLNIYARSFSVLELPRYKPSGELSSSVPPRVKDGDPLLLIHVSGCDGLQGTGFDDFQIDPLVTVRFGRKRFLVAPLVSGSTAPRWSYPKATVLVPVCLSDFNHVTLEVWDTNIELCDVLGVARVSLETLCQTGSHTFNLQPHKDQEYGRRQNLGTITLKTRFGSLNGEVVRPGASNFFGLESSCSASIYESRLFHTKGNRPDLPVTRVRLHVSSCCFIYPEVPIKHLKVTVSCLQHVFLEAKRDITKFFAAWSVDEAHAVIDLRAIYNRSILLTVSCSETSECNFFDIGSAMVPFSVLACCTPDDVSVCSFPLCDASCVSREVFYNKPERSESISVSPDQPSITVSLLATQAVADVSARE